jgi:hypothetical protein
MWSPDVLLPRWTASVNEALRVCATWVEQKLPTNSADVERSVLNFDDALQRWRKRQII